MFDDRLQVTLSLAIGSSTFSVAAGAMETIELDARVYGFEASVTFRVSSEGESDELFASFGTDGVMKATLTLANGSLAMSGEAPVVTTFVGYVTARSFRETTSAELSETPIVERAYTVRFADAARVFWSEHRPFGIYAGKSFKDILEANLVQGVSLTYDASALEEAHDVLCVGLGAEARASFYDYLFWIVSDSVGVVEFDGATSTYRLGSTKANVEEGVEIPAECLDSLRIELPSPRRHSTRVLNPFTEATTQTSDVTNTVAGSGVRRDVVAYTQIPKEMEQCVSRERARLQQPEAHVVIRLKRLLETVPAPNSSLTLGDTLGSRIYGAGKTYRLARTELRAGPPLVNPDDEPDLSDAAKRFGLEVTLECEKESDPVPVLPRFERPEYPFYAEGKILSASGEETDRTWYAMSENDSVVRYRVHVPLWNETVVVPFLPTGESGHFFFPAYKNQRVLLAFQPRGANIVAFLDWAGKLASETQGNQLVMGKRTTSGTVMKHVYTDNSPVFTLARAQYGDLQTLELSEGRFYLEVKEEESSERPSQSYDLTPEAEVAKDTASAQAREGISELTGSYQGSMATAAAELSGAKSEVELGIDSATSAIADKAAAIEAELAEQAADLDGLGDGLDQKVAAAKAALASVLED